MPDTIMMNPKDHDADTVFCSSLASLEEKDQGLITMEEEGHDNDKDSSSTAGKPNDPTRFASWRRLVVVTLVSVVAVLTLLVGLDYRRLKTSGRPTVQVHQVVVDVRHRQPMVQANVSLHGTTASTRWLTWQLQKAVCHYTNHPALSSLQENHVQGSTAAPMLRVDFAFEPQQQQQGHHDYTVTATVPAVQVQQHADALWQALVVGNQNSDWHVACHIDIAVRLGKRLGLTTYRHDTSWGKTAAAANTKKNGHAQQQDADNGTQKNTITTTTTTTWTPTVQVHTWGPDTLQVQVSSPTALNHDVVASNAQWHAWLPAVHLQAQSAVTLQSLHLQLDATNATVVWNVIEDDNEDKNEINSALVLSLSCQEARNDTTTLPCPWYRGVANTLLAGGGGRVRSNNGESPAPRTIDINLVDAQDSFLELVLGPNHEWMVDYYSTSSSDLLPADAEWMDREEDARKRQLDTEIPTYSEAKANCLHITDSGNGTTTSSTMDVAMCLLVDSSLDRQGNVVTVANMTFYDTTLVGVGQSHWFREGYTRTWKVDMRAKFDDADPGKAGKNPRLNITGDLVLDYWDYDASIDLALTNDGSWWPMTSIIRSSGTALDSVLDMVIEEVTLHADGEEYLTKATGVVFFDWDDLVMNASIADAQWDMKAQAEFGSEYRPTLTDPYAPPTPEPTPPPTSAPTSLTETFSFSYISMALIGAVSFDYEYDSTIAYTMETFYQAIYAETYTTSTGVQITDFNTTIENVWLNTDSNALYYDQEVTITTASGAPTLSLVTEVLTAPFESQNLTIALVDALKGAVPGFAPLSAMFPPNHWEFSSGEGNYYDDDYYDDGDDVTKVNFFRGNSTVSRNGQLEWDLQWFGEVWSFNYNDNEWNSETSETSTWWDIDHNFMIVGITENIENIAFDLKATMLNVYRETANYTSYEYIVLEDNSRFLLDFFKLKWGSTEYANSSGLLFVDSISQDLTVQAVDDARIDLVLDVGFRWYSEEEGDDEDILHLDRFDVTNFAKSRMYINLTQGELGTLYEDGTRATLQILSDPVAELRLETDSAYVWNEDTDLFRATSEKILVGWQGELQTDARGEFSIDFTADKIGFSLRDETIRVYSAEMETTWYEESLTRWGLNVSKAYLSTDGKVDLDARGSFGFRHLDREQNIFVEDGDPFGSLVMSSNSEAATMQMNMDMNFTWFEAEEYLQVIMDHCRMVYRDEVYIDTGVSSFAVEPAPSSAPSSSPPTMTATSQPTLVPTTVPTRVPATMAPSVSSPSPPTPSNTSSFAFTGIDIRLQGAEELPAPAIAAFERNMESYYTSFYSNTATGRRFLEGGSDITDFTTTVKVNNQQVDASGNTITYDQTITFNSATTVSDTAAQTLLTSPFENEQQRQEYVTALQAEDPAFADVATADEPSVPLPKETSRDVPTNDNDDDDGIPIYIFIVTGAALLCCCAAGGYYYQSRRGGNAMPGDDDDKHYRDDDKQDNPFPTPTPYNDNLADEGANGTIEKEEGFPNNDGFGNNAFGGDNAFDGTFGGGNGFGDNGFGGGVDGEEESSSGEEGSSGSSSGEEGSSSGEYPSGSGTGSEEEGSSFADDGVSEREVTAVFDL